MVHERARSAIYLLTLRSHWAVRGWSIGVVVEAQLCKASKLLALLKAPLFIFLFDLMLLSFVTLLHRSCTVGCFDAHEGYERRWYSCRGTYTFEASV